MSLFSSSPGTSSHWHITEVAIHWFEVLTRHYQLHEAEHVGMFAGSLLQREDWDH